MLSSLDPEAQSWPPWPVRPARAAAAKTLLESSLFTLLVSGPEFVEQFSLCLRFGSIPIIVDDGTAQLPFKEVIDWNRAALFVQYRDFLHNRVLYIIDELEISW